MRPEFRMTDIRMIGKRPQRITMVHLMVCANAVLASVWIAYLLRFDFQVPAEWLPRA